MRYLISSGDLMRLFLEGDPNTIIRRPKTGRNIRLNIMTLTYAVGVIFYCPFSKEIL